MMPVVEALESKGWKMRNTAILRIVLSLCGILLVGAGLAMFSVALCSVYFGVVFVSIAYVLQYLSSRGSTE